MNAKNARSHPSRRAACFSTIRGVIWVVPDISFNLLQVHIQFSKSLDGVFDIGFSSCELIAFLFRRFFLVRHCCCSFRRATELTLESEAATFYTQGIDRMSIAARIVQITQFDRSKLEL